MAAYKKTKSTPKRKPAKQGITYGEPNPEGPPPPQPAPKKTLSTVDIKLDKEP
jgi:hypothetical protein